MLSGGISTSRVGDTKFLTVTCTITLHLDSSQTSLRRVNPCHLEMRRKEDKRDDRARLKVKVLRERIGKGNRLVSTRSVRLEVPPLKAGGLRRSKTIPAFNRPPGFPFPQTRQTTHSLGHGWVQPTGVAKHNMVPSVGTPEELETVGPYSPRIPITQEGALLFLS